MCRYSEVKFGTFYYTKNTGSILFIRSKATFTNFSKFQNHKVISNISNTHGGAITSIASIIHFEGTTSFSDYDAQIRGGAIYAIES